MKTHPLKALRKERHLTQKQLADLAGVTQQTVSRIEAGGTILGGAMSLLKIARALDVSVADVCGERQMEMARLLDTDGSRRQSAWDELYAGAGR